MKKYFVFLLLLFFYLPIFLFSFASPAHAEKFPATCTFPDTPGSGKNQITFTVAGKKLVTYCNNVDEMCTKAGANFVTPRNTVQAESFLDAFDYDITGVSCEKPFVKATCINPNTPGSGKNGISFKMPDGKTGTTYCADVNAMCLPAGDSFRTPLNTLRDGSTLETLGIVLKGVSCEKPFAVGTCINPNTPGSGKNGISVKMPDGKKVTTYCADVNAMCLPAGDSFQTPLNTIKDGSTFETVGLVLKGVSCEKPFAVGTCINPNTPGSGKNGISVKLPNGKTVTTFCKTVDYMCKPAGHSFQTPLNTLNKDAEMIFEGLDLVLKGVSCEKADAKSAAPLPPPPSPPCKSWGTGQCLLFGTALGELSTIPGDFVSTLFAILLSFSGGIALLLIIKSGYQLMTSRGKPEEIQNGRDQFIAAIVGLAFIIFSFIILQVIGYDILRIPGFGGQSGGNIAEGSSCDANGNSQCQSGLTCVSQGGRTGICKKSVGASCDANGNNQCPPGQTCVATSGRFGTCK